MSSTYFHGSPALPVLRETFWKTLKQEIGDTGGLITINIALSHSRAREVRENRGVYETR